MGCLSAFQVSQAGGRVVDDKVYVSFDGVRGREEEAGEWTFVCPRGAVSR